ncbi:MAG: TlpA family protein disulfide reductase [Burkholderiaceae bacterium]|nr:TlpA family protein disulfide reductase [Burkholderiaceae bacterium]
MTDPGHAPPRASRRSLILAVVVALAAIAAGAWFGLKRFALESARTDAVGILMAQRLPAADGSTVRIDAFRGKVLVVNFWATWCPPCVEEMPELSDLQTRYRDKPVQMLGIGIDSAANVRRFAEKTPMSYPLLVAGNAGMALMQAFGEQRGALPFTLVLDRNGRVVSRSLGRFRQAELRATIDSALAAP